MNKEPQISHFLDDEEKAIIEAIEQDNYKISGSQLSEERRKELQTVARNTMNEERTRISLRVPKSDLSRLKAKALHEGIPYQTLINSILHQSVSN